MNTPEHMQPTNRRVLLKAGAAVVGLSAVGLGGVGLATARAQDSGASTAEACVLTPELTEGPYYLQGDLVRKNIVEDRAGLPLRLRIAVNDLTSCGPLANAAVDIWHCDAGGYYSGISGENPGDGAATTDTNLTTTFLRGIQLTDEEGIAEFETIYPGWYMGRTIHIHLKVAVDGTEGTTYEGGHVTHTGQLFFDDAISDQVYATGAYADRDNNRRTRNDSDNILSDHVDEPGFLLELTPISEDSFDDGFLGTITLGVDPTASPSQR